MTGFGLAHEFVEGSPIHPMEMHTNSKKHFMRQLKAWCDFFKVDINEEIKNNPFLDK